MYYLDLNKKEQGLLNLLLNIPPNFEMAEKYIHSEEFNGDEITRVAIQYADTCFCEAGWFADRNNIVHTSEIIPGLNSSYILEVTSFLLKYGLNPNKIYEDCNIMQNLRYIDNGYLAADTFNLLLKHGGNYNLIIDDEELFKAIDWDVFFDATEQYYRHRFASLVHIWMVMIGHGACCDGDKVKTFKEYDSSEYFDLQKLKNHQNYYFGITHLENDFAISIYDKNTLWEVARII